MDTNYSLDIGRYQRFQLDPSLGTSSTPQVKLGTSTVDGNHVVTSYTTALNSVKSAPPRHLTIAASSNILGVQRRDFQYDQKSKYLTTGLRLGLGRLKVKGMGSYAKADTTGDTNLISLSTGIAGASVDTRTRWDSGADLSEQRRSRRSQYLCRL